MYMKDKGGCVTSPVRINKLFLTKPICERMLQCTLTTKTKRAPMSRQPEPPNVRKHDLIRSDYKLNFTAKTIIIYALHQSTTSFGVLLHHYMYVYIYMYIYIYIYHKYLALVSPTNKYEYI